MERIRDVAAAVASAILGENAAEGLQARVPTYEELHAEAQNILIPQCLPRGVGVQIQQPWSKKLALTHRVLLEGGKPPANPFAAMMGGQQETKDEFGRPKHYRHYGLGAIMTRVLDNGGKLRLETDLDNDLRSRTNAMYDVTGTGRLRVEGQVIHRRVDGRTMWGGAATLRGEDYSAVVRAKDGPELGLSYLQRLVPGSPLTLGGEMLLALPRLSAVASEAASPAGSGGKPIEWSIGAAYDARTTKTGVHLDYTGTRNHTLSSQHLYRINERCTLAAKTIVDTRTWNSMVAAGYSLKFRNTATTVTSHVDTYGNVRMILGREIIKDVKVAFSGEVNLLAGGDNHFGLRLSVGQPVQLPRNLSPITMPRDIFGPNS